MYLYMLKSTAHIHLPQSKSNHGNKPGENAKKYT